MAPLEAEREWLLLEREEPLLDLRLLFLEWLRLTDRDLEREDAREYSE
jgi:hypothetical protein